MIDSSVIIIAPGAFKLCTSVVVLTFAAATSLTTIDASAFEGMSELAHVDMSGAPLLATIGASVFSGCGKLATAKLASATTWIGASAFTGTALSTDATVDFNTVICADVTGGAAVFIFVCPLVWTEGTGGGASWSARRNHAAVCFDDGVVVTTGGVDASSIFSDVQTTTPGGTALAVVALTPMEWRYLHAIARVPGDANSFLVVAGGGSSSYLNDALLTTDRGANFVTKSTAVFTSARMGSGLVATGATSFVAFGGGAGTALEYYNEVRRSVDLGVTWTTLRVNGPTSGVGTGGDSCVDTTMWSQRYGVRYAYMPLRKRILLAGGWNGVSNQPDAWGSDDGGVCWQLLTADISGTGTALWGPSLVVALLSGIEILILAGGRTTGNVLLNTVYRSLDAGATWELVASRGAMWSARASSALVFNPSNKRLATLGGQTGTSTYANDFWTASATTLVTTVRLSPPHIACALLPPLLVTCFRLSSHSHRNSLLSVSFPLPEFLSVHVHEQHDVHVRNEQLAVLRHQRGDRDRIFRHHNRVRRLQAVHERRRC